jgi:hypothetical protein
MVMSVGSGNLKYFGQFLCRALVTEVTVSPLRVNPGADERFLSEQHGTKIAAD